MSTRLKKHTIHHAKPYDRPKTFFQKVASTIHDMFVPSWMLYDSSCKSDSNVPQASSTHNIEDNTESQRNILQLNHQNISDKNEQTKNEYTRGESSKNIYMPEKRPTYSSYSTEINIEKRRREKAQYVDPVDNYSEFTQGKTNNLLKSDSLKSNVKLQKKSSIHQSFVNGDDHSDNSEGSASTSGCSSLVSSHQDRKDHTHDYGLQITEEALERIKKELSKKEEFKNKGEKRHISVETDTLNHGTDSHLNHNEIHSWCEEKILCPNKRARPQPTFLGRKPSFNLSSFGAPSLGNSSHAGENCCHSPFYEGKTAFGGASALNRSHLISSIPYPNMNISNTKLKVKDISSKKDFDYMSTTAKRILLSLEKMSTPLVDAKKIPTERKASVELCLRQKANLNTSASVSTSNGLKYQMTPSKPPSTGILIPSSSMIGKNLDTRISSDQISVNKVGFNIPGKIPETSAAPLTSLPVKSVGKIRARMSTTLHSSKKSNINEVVDVPDLPNIPLPIECLPTFNFNPSSEASRESCQSKQKNGVQFKFSSPIQHNAPPTPQIPTSEMCFTFSSPVSKETNTEKPSQNDKLRLESDSFSEKCSDDDDNAISSVQKDKESVEQKKIETIGFGEKFKPAVGSWECCSCLVRNLESAIKCIACESPNPKIAVSASEMSGFSDIKMESSKNSKMINRSCQEENQNENNNSFSTPAIKITTTNITTSTNTVIASTSTAAEFANTWHDFGDKFKPAAGNWSCPTCLISNNEIVLNCIACETPNPHHKPQTVEQMPAASFGAKFKPPPGSWECDTCFVQNSSDALKCIACETSRCVSSKPPDSTQMFSGFKFGNTEKQNSSFSLENTFNNNSSGFKFGMTTASGLSKSSEVNEFTFGSKITESRPHEGFKFNPSNFVATSSAFTFGGKTLQINSDSSNATNGKKLFGISHNAENSQTTNFDSKVLPVSFESNKQNPQLFGNQSAVTKSEASVYSLSKNSISPETSTVMTVTSNSAISGISSTPINIATTTVSMFNFGKPQPLASSPAASLPKNNEDTNVTLGTSNSCTFSFTSPQKIVDVSNKDNVVSDKVETNNANNENITPTISQKPVAVFSFGSGTQGTTASTNTAFNTSTSNNIFTFGAPVSFSAVSTQQNVINAPKNPFTPSTTSQVSFSNFGNKLSTTTFSHDSSQQKQGFGFTSLPEVQFNTPKSLPSNNVFRFGTLQDPKPGDNSKPNFSFGASQEQKPSSTDQTQKPPFSFNFHATPSEQKATPLSQDNCFNFNAAKGNDQEKSKSGFNFSFNPSQNIFRTPSTSTSAPATNFNFAGNVASSGSPFPFTASSSGTSQLTRKIKRAVRRSALGPGRREN